MATGGRGRHRQGVRGFIVEYVQTQVPPQRWREEILCFWCEEVALQQPAKSMLSPNKTIYTNLTFPISSLIINKVTKVTNVLKADLVLRFESKWREMRGRAKPQVQDYSFASDIYRFSLILFLLLWKVAYHGTTDQNIQGIIGKNSKMLLNLLSTNSCNMILRERTTGTGQK